jgi:hypothetical protein
MPVINVSELEGSHLKGAEHGATISLIVLTLIRESCYGRRGRVLG